MDSYLLIKCKVRQPDIRWLFPPVIDLLKASKIKHDIVPDDINEHVCYRILMNGADASYLKLMYPTIFYIESEREKELPENYPAVIHEFSTAVNEYKQLCGIH